MSFSPDKSNQLHSACTFLARNPRDGQSGCVQLAPERLDLAIYLAGWTIGWFLLWRLRPLPEPLVHVLHGPTDTSTRSAMPSRRGVAVIIPARNESASLPHLLQPLMGQIGPDDELVVVDDHSDDDTAAIARQFGAVVVTPPLLPAGWLGKPHACARGAAASTAPILLFLDADVRPAADLVERVAAAVERHPDAVVSIQPWHTTDSWGEQASVLCNITALMGCGAFTPLGPAVAATVAFGPVLALDRGTYERVGGHAAPAVRTMHTEDIGLARIVGRSELFTGRPDTSFRMYPDGLGQTITGWTRSIATGARFTPWWLGLATLAWVTSLAGGWLATPIVYPLSAFQLWVLGRRAVSIRPLTAVLYPLTVAAFVVIFLRSLLAVTLRRDVEWKGRRVEAR